jgi:hypothetical protein
MANHTVVYLRSLEARAEFLLGSLTLANAGVSRPLSYISTGLQVADLILSKGGLGASGFSRN